MKRTVLLFTAILISLSSCVPQKSAKSENMADILPSFQSFESTAVTTILDDALNIEAWIDVSDIEPETGNIDLNRPGYYRYDTRSYCLHAGKHGASSGEGYLIAPLKGRQASLIEKIVNSSHKHREIAQSDIQRIIWAIESGTSLLDFSGQQAIAISILANPKDLARYELDVQTNTSSLATIARTLLPKDVQEALNFYDSFKEILTDANSSYEDIERLAVLSGFVEAGPGSQLVEEGNWAKVAENTFMRSYPQSYKKTTVEILKLADFNIEKDEQNRIILFESNGFRQEISYNENLKFVTAPDGLQYPYWEIKELLLTEEGSNDRLIIKDAGWLIPSYVKLASSSLSERNLSYDLSAQNSLFDEYRNRIQDVNSAAQELADYYEKSGQAEYEAIDQDFGTLFDLNHYLKGVKAALSDSLYKKSKWLVDHFRALNDTIRKMACIIAGGCSDDRASSPSEPNDDSSSPSKDQSNSRYAPAVSTPGNTSRQRLYTDWTFGKY